jgi:hypothetical protein
MVGKELFVKTNSKRLENPGRISILTVFAVFREKDLCFSFPPNNLNLNSW